MFVGNRTLEADRSFRRVLLLPTLLLCVFLSYTFSVFITTLLVDIAPAFKVSIGTISLLGIIGNGMGIIMGLAMSAITIRFKHKSLLLLGIALYAVGDLGFFFAQNFAEAIAVSIFLGTGAAVVLILVYTLIGELLPLEKRGWAIGLVFSSFMAAFVVVAPLSGFIDSIAGWRPLLLWFIFPFSMVCLALCLLFIPTKQPQPQLATRSLYSQMFKTVFMKKSPTACVVSASFIAVISVVSSYAVSFYRTVFSVSPMIGGVFASIAAAGGIVGGAIGGRLINRYGRKPIAVTAVLISGVSCILFTFIPVVAFSVALWALCVCTQTLSSAGQGSLSIEQIPEYRSSMMSINVSFANFGIVLGIIIGGLVLNLFCDNFHLLMVLLGALGASAAAILLFFARDPCAAGSTR